MNTVDESVTPENSIKDLIKQDEKARQTITDLVDESWFVEAGAGSGKTYQLVERYMTLIIEKGIAVEQIVAITFTEAAAGELVSRLRRSLTEIEAKGFLEDQRPTGKREFSCAENTARDRARTALQGLPAAPIETLHAFCLRLLKQYPLEAGIPPQVEKMDDLRAFAESQKNEAEVRDLITDLLMNKDSAEYQNAVEKIRELNCGVEAEHLREALQELIDQGVEFKDIDKLPCIVTKLDKQWGRMASVQDMPLETEPYITNEFLRQVLETWESVVAECTDDQNEFYQSLMPTLDSLRAHCDSGAEGTAWTGSIEYHSHAKKWKGAWPRPLPEIRNGVLKPLKDKLEKLRKSEEKRPIVDALMVIRRLLVSYAMANVKKRIKTGYLQYHDMIFLARDLLRNNEDARFRIHKQFRTIFVDEFQDTDPSQLAILEDIARGGETEPVSGYLFMVGDPKQSIYSFRNADIDTYMTAQEAFDEKGRKLQLSRNYRSSRSVIESVNTIFEKLFGFQDTSISPDIPRAVPYEPMIPSEEAKNSPYPGKVLFLRAGGEKLLQKAQKAQKETSHSELKEEYTARSEKEAELFDILTLIKAALANKDGSFVHHAGEKQGQALEVSDIAVLVPKHDLARAVMKKLDSEGIPYVSEGSILLFASPEVSDILSVLRSIADPADSFAQVAALRSMMLGSSDEDIAEYFSLKAEGKSEENHPVHQALEWLHDKHRRSRNISVGELVREVIEDRELSALLSATRNLSSLRRLDALMLSADTYSRETGLGLRSFVQWADEQATDNQGLSDPIVDDKTEGVRLMTIHAAKGREFPMVIVAGMAGGRSSGGNGVSASFSKETNIPEYKLTSGYATAGYEKVTDYEKKEKENGELRNLYVAATRAESILAIPVEVPFKEDGGVHAGKRGSSLCQALLDLREEGANIEFLDAEDFDTSDWDTPGAWEKSHAVPDSARTGAENFCSQTLFEELENRRLASANSTARVPRISVTAIAHAEDQHEEENKDTVVMGDAVARNLYSSLQKQGWSYSATVAIGEEKIKSLGRKGSSSEKQSVEGNRFGSVVHEIMEQLPQSSSFSFSNDDKSTAGLIKEIATPLMSLHDLDEEQIPAVIDTVLSLADSEPFKKSIDLVKGESVHREISVIDQIEGVAVEGVIDLLYKDGDSWVVADYKTDRSLRAKTIESYFLQLELYARILEKTTDIPVSRLELIIASRGAQSGDVCVLERS